MNISQLRTFLAVIECGSFSEAAKALGISQPAVTMQVQSLESDLGVTLLDRRYRRIDLTEAGRLLEPHARRTLAEVDSARDEIEQLSGEVGGRLEIAASTTPGAYVVPRLLGAFVSAYPSVSVTVTVHDTAGVVAAVEEGRAHLGVAGAVVEGRQGVVSSSSPSTSSSRSARRPRPLRRAHGRAPRRPRGAGLGHARAWVRHARHGRARARRRRRRSGQPPRRRAARYGGGDRERDRGWPGNRSRLRVTSPTRPSNSVRSFESTWRASAILRPFYTVLPKGTPTRAAVAFNAHLHTVGRGLGPHMSRTPRRFKVLGFASTHDALDAEALLLDLGIDVVPIPAPKTLGTLCGIALRLEVADETRALDLPGRCRHRRRGPRGGRRCVEKPPLTTAHLV